MPDIDDDLPPLGEPTPALRRRRSARRTRPAVTASLGVAAGLCLGVPLGLALSDDGGGAHPSDAAAIARGASTRVTTTTTTVPRLPQPCVETMRSAEQALSLLDQGLQSLRRLDVGELDRLLSTMERLRNDFSGNVRMCLERTGS